MAIDLRGEECTQRSLNWICRVSSFMLGFSVIFSEGFYFVTDQQYEEELKLGNIIPDVVDKIPEDVLQVEYYNGIEPNLGHILTAHEVYIPPVSVRWRLVDRKKLHTIILMDLDAPITEKPTDRSYVHWMLMNVKGEQFRKPKRNIKAAYQPVIVPEEDKGKHRLVFLCYIQKENITIEEKFDDKDGNPDKVARSKFSHSKFAEKYNFDRLTALNWFYVEHYPNFTYTTIHPEALKI
ncbi:protein D1 [Bemisia tabaci]|uniref:protein D1 n=1 Tax=Bemisia tabaci TaxID=7038 RepID=UPI003B2818A5